MISLAPLGEPPFQVRVCKARVRRSFSQALDVLFRLQVPLIPNEPSLTGRRSLGKRRPFHDPA
jgi:hypothetical protein